MRKKGGPEFECLKISFSFALFEFLPFSVSVLLLSLRCYKLFNHWTGLSCSADIKLLTLTELSDGAIIICLKFKNMQ
jgi:hypothetical protein